MLRAIFAVPIFFAAMTATAFADPVVRHLPPQPAAHPDGIPAAAMMLSPCIASMGEHWGDPGGTSTGPFYGVWQGKPVFSEIMVSVKDLDAGFAYTNLRALPGYAIDHVDFDFEPHGHPGFPVPHYDVHEFYVSPAEQAKICPNGIPDPAMTPMAATPAK